MTELLAVPCWDVGPTPLAAWVDRLRSQGLAVRVEPESSGVSWVEVPALRLRGYAVLAGDGGVEAINFELTDPDPAPARAVVDRAAADLAWEVHDDDDAADDDD